MQIQSSMKEHKIEELRSVENPNSSTSKKKKILLIVLAVLLLAGLSFGAYFFYTKYNEIRENPNLVAEEEIEYLVGKVGKLMDLPANEKPTVATVMDREKLATQEFFKNAENGDKLLAYVGAKKAILYRPSTDRIIEVAPIYITTDGEKSE